MPEHDTYDLDAAFARLEQDITSALHRPRAPAPPSPAPADAVVRRSARSPRPPSWWSAVRRRSRLIDHDHAVVLPTSLPDAGAPGRRPALGGHGGWTPAWTEATRPAPTSEAKHAAGRLVRVNGIAVPSTATGERLHGQRSRRHVVHDLLGRSQRRTPGCGELARRPRRPQLQGCDRAPAGQPLLHGRGRRRDLPGARRSPPGRLRRSSGSCSTDASARACLGSSTRPEPAAGGRRPARRPRHCSPAALDRRRTPSGRRQRDKGTASSATSAPWVPDDLAQAFGDWPNRLATRRPLRRSIADLPCLRTGARADDRPWLEGSASATTAARSTALRQRGRRPQASAAHQELAGLRSVTDLRRPHLARRVAARSVIGAGSRPRTSDGWFPVTRPCGLVQHGRYVAASDAVVPPLGAHLLVEGRRPRRCGEIEAARPGLRRRAVATALFLYAARYRIHSGSMPGFGGGRIRDVGRRGGGVYARACGE